MTTLTEQLKRQKTWQDLRGWYGDSGFYKRTHDLDKEHPSYWEVANSADKKLQNHNK